MSGTDMRQTIRDAADLLEERLKMAEEGAAALPFDDMTYSQIMDNWLGHDTGALASLVHPAVAKHLVTLLRTEAASTAGDEDHSPCTAEKCATVAAYELALSILSTRGDQ